MALGSKMDDAVHVLVLHQLVNAVKVADVHLDKAIVGLILYVLEVGEVARVGQLVKVDDLIFGVFVDKQTYHMIADKTRTAGDKY